MLNPISSTDVSSRIVYNESNHYAAGALDNTETKLEEPGASTDVKKMTETGKTIRKTEIEGSKVVTLEYNGKGRLLRKTPPGYLLHNENIFG